MTMKKSVLIAAIAISCSSCLYDNGETIVLPVDDITLEQGMVSAEVIPTEIKERFTRYMTIYEGSNPPIITGYYVLDPLTTVYCSDERGYDVGEVIADLYIYFGEQNKWNIDEYKEKQVGTIGTAKDVVIVGSGNHFTAYCTVEENLDEDGNGKYETYAKTSLLFSGTLTDYGIENAQYAFIMLEKNDPLNEMMEENEFRIFKDGDGLASTCTWGYYAPSRMPQETNLGINTLTKEAKKDYE